MKKRKGASIVLILIMVMLLSVLGAQVLATLNSETRANMNKVDNTQTAYVAQAMAESFAVYIKEQSQDAFLNLYKLAKENGLVITKNSPPERKDSKYYTPIEVKASDLKKITESGNLAVTEEEFKDFRAEGIIKFYDLSEDNPEIKKNQEITDASKIKKVKVRAEGWYNKGSKENPDYVFSGIDMFFVYGIDNQKVYGDQPATIIAKNNFILNNGVKTKDLTDKIKVKYRISSGMDSNVIKLSDDLKQGIERVNKDNNYYDYRMPEFPSFKKIEQELQAVSTKKFFGRDVSTKDKIIVNKIAEYFDSTRPYLSLFKTAPQELEDFINYEKNINGTLHRGTYYGGSKWFGTKTSYKMGRDDEGVTSGIYHRLRSKNNALSSYTFVKNNTELKLGKGYLPSRSIYIDTKENEITKIMLKELDVQAPIIIRGKGIVHFYVSDFVRIGNLSTIFTESFIFTDPIEDTNEDKPILVQEVVNPSGGNHFKNNASRVTVFYEGTKPVVLQGTIEQSINIVSPYADINYSPTVAQSALVGRQNLSFKGVLISGEDININLGHVGLAWGNSFKYHIKGLFYAPYGSINLSVKKPSIIAGTMIAENIIAKFPGKDTEFWSNPTDITTGNPYLELQTGYSYDFGELHNRGIKMKKNQFMLKFMESI